MMSLDLKQYPANIELTEHQMVQEILSNTEKVEQYEDELLQAQARSVIPSDLLEEKARKQSAQTPASISQSTANNAQDKSAEFRHELLLQLLRWFKLDFFSWCDAPECSTHQKTGVFAEHCTPTAAELSDGASRVEGYRCPVCDVIIRFPRYNNPGKLLETRKGRCGEFANCFTLCCRAMNFEARFVVDTTDHVWTEVWSDLRQRWLHCDPCENVCDRPLLYEQGWGKTLSYVVAYSAEEVVDVSWRYSLNHAAMLRRRLTIREHRLVALLREINRRKHFALSEAHRKVLLDRSVRELIEMLSPKLQLRDGSDGGRTSGSTEWRQQRGELGQAIQGVELTVQSTEIAKKEFVLHYFCAEDQYVRPNSDDAPSGGFESLAFRTENVFRKEEFDWKMAYVCRTEDASAATKGCVEWRINTGGVAEALSAEVSISSKTFEGASVDVVCRVGDACFKVSGGRLVLTEEDLKKCSRITITATLSGGAGKHAWQHAQLCRTAIGGSSSNAHNQETADLTFRIRFK